MSRVPKPKINVGDIVGKLTVVSRCADQERYRGAYICKRRVWMCKCECGNHVAVREDSLTSATRPTRSCGCLQSQNGRTLGLLYGGRVTHGESRERLRNIWYLMLYRCQDPKSPAYANYGGRGITVCDSWADASDGYKAFKSWALLNGYDDSLTIDRIDNNGNYCPENCRWITLAEQAGNRRITRFVEYNGVTKTLSQWSLETGIPLKALYARIYRSGWPIDRALTQPIKTH